MKSRAQKAAIYEEKYANIPRDYSERLAWLYDNLKLDHNICSQILLKRDMMMEYLYYTELKIVLYEEPEGSPRPRFRLVNRYNLREQAITNSNFVHVYSITGAADNKYMKRLLSDNDFFGIEQLIYTPCDINIDMFFKTPTSFNRIDTILSEIGLIRPITKPDWDNGGKKYSDMFNANIWLDDKLVINGTVRKFYSVLPRVEITLNYLNALYNAQQAKAIGSSLEACMQGTINYFDFNSIRKENNND